MEKKWTKEPWELVVEGMAQIRSSKEESWHWICDTAERISTPDEEELANASRIVSCVNALAGIENPEAFVNTVLGRIRKAEKQRDDLLEACKLVMEYIEICHSCKGRGIKHQDCCHTCGGTGKLIKQSITSEIHAIEEAISHAEAQ